VIYKVIKKGLFIKKSGKTDRFEMLKEILYPHVKVTSVHVDYYIIIV